MNNAPEAITSPTEAVNAQAQPATTTGPAVINAGRKQEPKTYLNLLAAARYFALQIPQSYVRRLEKLYSVRNSLPQDEEPVQIRQEQREKIEGDIQKLEASYQDFIQHFPDEEEKKVLTSITDRAMSIKRRELEEHDKLGQKYVAAREIKAEIELFRQEVDGLRVFLPDLIMASQSLDVFLNQKFDF